MIYTRKVLNLGSLLLKLSLLVPSVTAIDLDINDPNSIKEAASIASDNAWTFYTGDKPGGIPGILVQPYYWWECGAMFGLLIERWSITGNTSYNNEIKKGMLFQVGEDKDYKPINQTKDLGNDDQLYWALAAMDAAELGFPDPPSDQPSWLGLAQAVFNEQALVWDPTTCKGGMRWQIYNFNPGWDYKNTMTNGGFFQLAARLARYTGNSTYAYYAERSWNWLSQTPIFDNSTAGRIHIWDGIWVDRCTTASEVDWSYNSATLIVGAAYLWSHYNLSSSEGNTTSPSSTTTTTTSLSPSPSSSSSSASSFINPSANASTISTLTLWASRINLILNSTDIFYRASPLSTLSSLGPRILIESCEVPTPQICDQDQPIFKAFTTRWMALTSLLAPWTNTTLHPRLLASAQGAAQACVGSSPDAQQDGTVCGRRWDAKGFDGNYGVGEQLSAMSAFQSLLLGVPGVGGTRMAKGGSGGNGVPYTTVDGGTSKSDPGAGDTDPSSVGAFDPGWKDITNADRAGAAIVTVLGVGGFLGALGWASFL